MNTFEQTIAKQKLILTRAVMILAGVVCFSLLAVVKMTALEEVLCSVLGVTLVTFQWFVYRNQWQKLGAATVTVFSSIVILVVISASESPVDMSTYYYMPAIVACAVILQGPVWGAGFLTLFSAFQLLLIFGVLDPGLIDSRWQPGGFTDRLLSLGFIYGLVAYANYTMSLALQKISDGERKLHMQDKLAALGVFSGGIAHEINNPLAIIRGFTSQLTRWMEDNVSDSSAKIKLERINSNVQRIADVTHSLLTLGQDSQVQAASHQSLSFQQVAADAIFLLQKKSEGVKVPIENKVDVKLIGMGSPNHLRMIMRIIIDNALDALMTSDQKNPRVVVTSHLEKDRIILQVEDNGPGIDPNIQKNIFDPFFTTKESGKGSGVGLALVAKICSTLGWEIKCESRQGCTKFCVTLPQEKSCLVA